MVGTPSVLMIHGSYTDTELHVAVQHSLSTKSYNSNNQLMLPLLISNTKLELMTCNGTTDFIGFYLRVGGTPRKEKHVHVVLTSPWGGNTL